jgi:hypothetical protein
VIVPESLIAYIADRSHIENESSGGKEGGRIVSKKISEIIEVAIQTQSQKHREAFKACRTIEMVFLPPGPARPSASPPDVRVDVRFLPDGPDAGCSASGREGPGTS